jgi:hypothetical protein
MDLGVIEIFMLLKIPLILFMVIFLFSRGFVSEPFVSLCTRGLCIEMLILVGNKWDQTLHDAFNETFVYCIWKDLHSLDLRLLNI